MAATRSVFATSLDLVLLDHSHGVLGGGAKKQTREETEDFSAAEHGIRDILQDLSPFLPVTWTDVGFAYFVPALTMSLAARVKCAAMTDLERTKVAARTKRVFVDGEEFLDYGGSGKEIPDADFWSAMFEFDADYACTDAEIAAASNTEFGPIPPTAFWFERCIERDGIESRLMDRLDLHELCAGRTNNLVESIVVIVKDLGWKIPSDLFERTYFGAVGNPRG